MISGVGELCANVKKSLLRNPAVYGDPPSPVEIPRTSVYNRGKGNTAEESAHLRHCGPVPHAPPERETALKWHLLSGDV